MSTVSAIMPSYNHAEYIAEAIESVLNQSFADLELIIIDDASKDNSKEIIRFYQEKDNRVRTIFHTENEGIAKTLNEGIEQAKGKFIAIIPSDDIWCANKLQKQLDILDKNEDLIVWSDGLIIDGQGHSEGKLLHQMIRHSQKKKRSGSILPCLLCGNYIWITSIIFKKANISNIRFDEDLKYLNDHKFLVDLAKHYEYHFISEPLIKYRIHGANSILQDNQGWENDSVLVQEYFLEKYRTELPRKTRSKMLFRISRNQHFRGDLEGSKKNVLRAVLNYPFRIRYLRPLILSFGSNSRYRNAKNL